MLYDRCRMKSLVMREVPKPGGREVETRVAQFPNGFSILPYRGGLLDQPAFLVDAFYQFLNAERAAAMKALSK